MTIVVVILALCAVLSAWVVWPLLGQNSSEPPVVDPEADNGSNAWRQEKDRLVEEMVALDIAFSEGRLAEEDYAHERNRLMSQAEHAVSRLRKSPRLDRAPIAQTIPRPSLALALALFLVAGTAVVTDVINGHDENRAGNPHADGRIPLPDGTKSASTSQTAREPREGQAMKLPDQTAGAPDIGAMVARLEARVKSGNAGVDDIVMLARSYGVLKREAESIELYRRARSMSPEDMTLNLVVASALIRSSREGDQSDGNAIVEDILSRHPEQPEALWLKSLGLIQRHEIVPARKTLKRLSGLVVDNPAATAAVKTMLAKLASTPETSPAAGIDKQSPLQAPKAHQPKKGSASP